MTKRFTLALSAALAACAILVGLLGGSAFGQTAAPLASQEVVDAAIQAAKADNCSHHLTFVGTIAHEDGSVNSVCGDDREDLASYGFAEGEAVHVIPGKGTADVVKDLVKYFADDLRNQILDPTFDGTVVWSNSKRCQFDGLKVDASQAPTTVDAGNGENPGTLSAAGMLAFIFTGERDSQGNELHVKVAVMGGCGGVAPTTTTTAAATTTTSQVTTTTAPPEQNTVPSTSLATTTLVPHITKNAGAKMAVQSGSSWLVVFLLALAVITAALGFRRPRTTTR